MDSALIVSYSEKSKAYLQDVLKEAGILEVFVVTSVSKARQMLIEADFDLCIINAPLPDEFGEGLAKDIAEKGIAEVILIVKSEIYEDIAQKTEDYGIMTVAKPIHKPFLWNALKMAQTMHKRVKIAQNENKKLIQKIEDIRIVDRAKCILISHLSMSEAEAHRYIEKQAMDGRTTRREVAEEILRTHEN